MLRASLAHGLSLAHPPHAVQMLTAELSRLAQELDHALQLLGGEAVAQARRPVGGHRTPDLVGPRVPPTGHLHLDAAAVLWIGDSARIAGALEAVDDAGHCAAREPGPLRQLPRGEPAAALDDVDRVEVGAVQPEPLGGHVVEGVVLVSRHAELADQLSDQLLLRLSTRRHDDLLSTKIFSTK